MNNVFTFLGLPAKHRPKNKVVQMVKHFDEVPKAKVKYPLLGQVKLDGVFAMAVINDQGEVGIFGRTGEKLTSTHVVSERFNHFMEVNKIFIGELISQHPCSLEELSGVVNPDRVNPLTDSQKLIAGSLVLAVHDFLTTEEFINGVSKRTYNLRYSHLYSEYGSCFEDDFIIGSSLIYDEFSKDEFTSLCLKNNQEGAVYKQPNELWLAGHKGYRVMKEVGEVSYDLLCTRVEEGKGKYKGLVANMYFRWKDGTEIKAMPGKGHTHESCRNMWRDNSLAIGRIWRVKGLCNSSKGKVRLPKVEEERHDKYTPDY